VRKPTPPGQHIRLKRRFVRFRDGTSKARKMLKLRTIGIRDYVVLEGKQRIGWIRLATERMPFVWLWRCCHPSDRRTPMGSSKDIDTAKAEFKAAWKALKATTPPEQLAAAYKVMNIRDDG
jgi:hypothetical protein